MLSIGHGDGAIGLHAISTEGDTLLETLDNGLHALLLTCLSDERLREEINDGGGVGQLHGVFRLCAYYRAEQRRFDQL